MNGGFENPISNNAERPAEPAFLPRGTFVKLQKRSVHADSAVTLGAFLEGKLEKDVRIGEPIILEGGKGNTSPVQEITHETNRTTIKTATSTYELVQQPRAEKPAPNITKRELENELAAYRTKKYGEWDLVNGRVPLRDNPYDLLLRNNGFSEGNLVTFFCERERKGVVYADAKGGLGIKASDGSPWGIAAVLNDPRGYIRKI